MTHTLFALSEAIASLAGGCAPWLTAIRVGSHQHATGIAWNEHTIVAADRALPALDSFAVVVPGGHLAVGRVLHRDAERNLALLRLDGARVVPAMPKAQPPAIGSLAIVVGADSDATPTVRLTTVHRHAKGGELVVVLDLTAAQAEPGSLVLDATGAVLGVVQIGHDGVVAVMPHRTIAHCIETAPHALAQVTSHALAQAAPPPAVRITPATPPRRAAGSSQRGWFGVALQPITVPEQLVPRAGQSSGRQVVGITAGGPAELAGLRLGDVLLSLDGHSTSGPHSLRAFLESSRVGSTVEVRLLRDGTLASARLTVAEAP